MDARWLPILAAVLGVLGGVLGALVGGWIANEGQEDRFESERKAQIQDSRIAVYGNFVGTADALAITLLADTAPSTGAETNTACEPDRDPEPSSQGDPDSPVSEDQIAAYQQVLVDKARVLLIVDETDVGIAAFDATTTLAKWMEALAALDEELAQACVGAYTEDINHFLQIARRETHPPSSSGR